MTNFERIKAMSVEELAVRIQHLVGMDCGHCPLVGGCFKKYPVMSCTEKVQKWLESEVE